ncbi:MAG: caspase family protein [Kofleriaceae bacterium]|nr:caspase family protein [Kofleriaceae bacterium]
MRRAAFLVLALVLCGSRAYAGRDVAYAIVIGNNAPPSSGTPEKLAPLRYADDDAVRYFQLFSRMADTRLLVVLDTQTQRRYPGLAAHTEAPTLANLDRVVGELAAKMELDRRRGDRPVLYFAFSGHGARDDHGDAFLALVDGALTQQKLYDDVLARMPTAFTHLIVDACNAGGVVGVRGGFFDREANTQSAPTTADDVKPILEATPLSRYPQVGVILATTLGQESHEWSAIESGVFTHELLSGLLGAADVNADRRIEYTELQAFIAAANRNIKDPRATPHVIARPPQLDQNVALVSLTDLRGMRMVQGNASALGHFHVELDNGQRYLDAHLEPGAPVAFALPDATTAFLRTDTQEATLPSSGPVALASVSLGELRSGSRGSIEASYQQALFSADYGRAYYQGYVDSIGAVGVHFPPASVQAEVHYGSPTKRRVAIGGGLVATGLGITAIATAVVALNAKHDFETTNLQRPAEEARQRYERYGPIAVVTGAAALATGAISYWLWRDSKSNTRVVPLAPGNAGTGMALEVTW